VVDTILLYTSLVPADKVAAGWTTGKKVVDPPAPLCVEKNSVCGKADCSVELLSKVTYCALLDVAAVGKEEEDTTLSPAPLAD